MDPIKLISYIAAVGVMTLIVMGGAGFYAGYSAGRGDLSEVKTYIQGLNLPASAVRSDAPPSVTAALDLSQAPDFTPILNEIKSLGAQVKKLERIGETPQSLHTDFAPVLTEIKALGGQIKRLEESASGGRAPDLTVLAGEMRSIAAQLKKLEKLSEQQPADLSPVMNEVKAFGVQLRRLEKPAATPASDFTPVLMEVRAVGEILKKLEKAQEALNASREDPRLREELGRLKQLAASAGEQLNSCQLRVAALETRPQATPVRAAPGETQVAARGDPPAQGGGAVVLYDSFYLKKDQNKAFDDVSLNVLLQGVASRSARVDINQQTVSIAFGERKEIVYNNMTCELNLMETDLSAGQARFNIACKK